MLAILGIVALSFLPPGPTALDTATAQLVAELPGFVGWFWEISYDLLIVWSLVLLLLALVALGGKACSSTRWSRSPWAWDRRSWRQGSVVPIRRRASRVSSLLIAGDLPRDTGRRGDGGDRDGVAPPVPPAAAPRPLDHRLGIVSGIALGATLPIGAVAGS